MYNKIVLIGNLTRNPELKYTPNGMPITTFKIANTKVGEDRQETLFIDITSFGKTAEAYSKGLQEVCVSR